MFYLSVYLIHIKSYPAFSNMAVDHWCLSLNRPSKHSIRIPKNPGKERFVYDMSYVLITVKQTRDSVNYITVVSNI